MTPDAALQAFPFLYPFFTALLGLVVGSFLNVVILRLPVMMERQWRRDCAALLALDGGHDDGGIAGANLEAVRLFWWWCQEE